MIKSINKSDLDFVVDILEERICDWRSCGCPIEDTALADKEHSIVTKINECLANNSKKITFNKSELNHIKQILETEQEFLEENSDEVEDEFKRTNNLIKKIKTA